MSKKTNFKYIKKSFEKEGYKLLNSEYVNAHSKLDYICPKGHKHNVSWSDWQRGHRCSYCAGNGKPTIEFIKSEFEKENYKLLTKKYKNNSHKLEYICPNNHRHSISWRDWHSKGARCPYCAGRPIITIDIIRKSMFDEGYILLTDVYINNKQSLDCVCTNGHKYTTNWAKWNSHGYRCSQCYGNAKKSIVFIKKDIENNGYTLITNNYTNCNGKLHLICPNGHDYYVSWDNWNHNGSRCPKCNEIGISKEEKVLVDFIKYNFNGKMYTNNYSVITPKELDIVIPEKKIAIEYCGLYWHSELMGKNKEYHLNKLNMCNEVGYGLITVFSDELNYTKEVVFSRLGNILGINLNTIYARKCIIQEISSTTARIFCEENHLQGYGSGSSIKLGAFYDDELVSVMTFSKPSLSKGYKKQEFGVWELHRFCSKINYRVVGIASKLLKYFERNYDWTEIFSYADRRWSIGNVYEKLGFSFVKNTQPNYWYLKGQCKKRINRFSLRKKPEEPKNVTEWELRKVQGYNRIWDCGNLKYVKCKSY